MDSQGLLLACKGRQRALTAVSPLLLAMENLIEDATAAGLYSIAGTSSVSVKRRSQS